MSHNITVREDGRAEVAYVGGSLWHRLGKYLGDKLVTSAKMIVEAGVDWAVEPRDLFYRKLVLRDADGNLVPDGTPGGTPGYEEVKIESHVVNVRADTQEGLGIVGKDYKAIQNRTIFELMDEVVGQASAMYEVAGSLRGGRRVWALAKLPQELVIVGDDVVRQYLLFVNDHDGSGSAIGGFTATRAVCENTVSAALSRWASGIANTIRIRHVGDVKAKAEEARRILGISLRYFEVAGQVFRAMSAREIGERMLQEYYEKVLPLPAEPARLADLPELAQARYRLEREKARAIHVRLAELFESGAGATLPGAKGTVWGAYNSITEFIDHVKVARRGGGVRKGADEAAAFGEGSSIRQRAFDEALALLK